MLGGYSVPDYEKLQVEKFYFQIKYNEILRKHQETFRFLTPFIASQHIFKFVIGFQKR